MIGPNACVRPWRDESPEGAIYEICLGRFHWELSLEIRILADADSVAREAAAIIAGEAWEAVAARGRFVVAFSGGHTPWQMLRVLAGEKVPWKYVHVV